MSHRAEIDRLLRSWPSDWKRQWTNARAQLKALEYDAPAHPDAADALMALYLTAGGRESGDPIKGTIPVPAAVREEAMRAVRMAHRHNYGAWNFIGLARAIQLATVPRIDARSVERMRAFFTRHAKDANAPHFGDNKRPSRGYLAHLVWGGDPAKAWVMDTEKQMRRNGRMRRNPSDLERALAGDKNLSGANLSRANLFNANLSGANLFNANLSGANLVGADLRGASLTHAVLRGANLRVANLEGASLREADLSGAKLSDADLSGANLPGADLTDADLTDANLSGADLADANLSKAYLRDANLLDADLSGANLTKAYLSGAKLRRANLSRANLSEANLTEAKLVEANLIGANLTGADLSEASLHRANLTGANLTDVDLSEAFYVHTAIVPKPEGTRARALGRMTGPILKAEKPDAPQRAADFKRRYPAEFERLKGDTQGRDLVPSLRSSLRKKYETPFDWHITVGKYKSDGQRYCPTANRVLMFNLDLDAPQYTPRQKEFLAKLREMSTRSGHPSERSPYFTVGWVRLCANEEAQTVLIEEVQSDVSVVRKKLKDGSAPEGLQEYADVLADFAPIAERFYADAIGYVFMEAEKQGYTVEMLDYAAKQQFGSPRELYTDLPRSMGMRLGEVSRVVPEAGKAWSYKPNPARVRKNPESLVFYHGAQQWEGPPQIVAHRKGHAEHGPGIYLTTSWTTASKYAKGGGSVYRIEVSPSVRWLEKTDLPVEETLRWVKSLPRLRGKADIVASLERTTARIGRLPAEILVNVFVNHDAASGANGPALAEYLVRHGVDASHISTPLFSGSGAEDWVVIFNPKIIEKVTRLSAKDVGEGFAFDLPRVRRNPLAQPSPTMAFSFRKDAIPGVVEVYLYEPEELDDPARSLVGGAMLTLAAGDRWETQGMAACPGYGPLVYDLAASVLQQRIHATSDQTEAAKRFWARQGKRYIAPMKPEAFAKKYGVTPKELFLRGYELTADDYRRMGDELSTVFWGAKEAEKAGKPLSLARCAVPNGRRRR